MAMKKNLLVLASAIVALMMSACVKDSTNDVNLGTGVEHTVTASIEPMTRTSMYDMEVGETSQVVWSSGDKIGLVTETGTIVQATINAASVGKEVAEFTVSDTNASASTKYIYGFYPYQSGVAYDATNKKLTGVCLENKRKFIINTGDAANSSVLVDEGLTFATNQLPMVAKADANGNLVFKSTCGIIELQLTSSKSINFFNFTIHSSSKELSAYGTVDLTADEPTFVPYHMATYSYNTISAKQYGTHSAYMAGADNNNKGVNLNNNNPTKLFFVVPIGTYDDLQIQVGCPALVVTKNATQSHTVKRNTILAFKPFDVNAVDNIYGGDDVIDLSADGYAYTYLVPTSDAPKKYKFTAKMVGDTKDFQLADGTLIKPDATTGKTHTNQNYNTTYVYAEDSKGVVTNLRREGDVVYFTASKPGNAIIMIGSSSLERVNQFHIWVSDAKDQQLPGGHVFLDRNLGATYAPSTLAEAKAMSPEQIWRAAGCLYQWGNPTPRPSMTPKYVPATYTSLASSGNATWNTNSGWNLYPWSVDAYSIRMFGSGATASDLLRSRMYYNFYFQSSTAYSGSSAQLWWHADRTTYGDLRFGDKALWQEEKTQFDPCPVGYRVPSKQEMVEAFTNSGAQTGKQYKIAAGAGGQYYEYNNQFVFVSWSGLRKCNDSALFNSAFTDFPRCGWWFYDPDLTDADDLVATYSGDGCYMFYGANKDMYTKDVNIGKTDVYPAVELRNSLAWASNAQADGANVGAPATNAMRYPVNTGMGIRCVRDSKTIQPSSVAPSYDVNAATTF